MGWKPIRSPTGRGLESIQIPPCLFLPLILLEQVVLSHVFRRPCHHCLPLSSQFLFQSSSYPCSQEERQELSSACYPDPCYIFLVQSISRIGRSKYPSRESFP